VPVDDRWTEETLASLPAWTLVQAYHTVARQFLAAFAEAGLGPTQFGVLASLDANPELGQAELARRTLVSPQSIGELIATLEERGLVERSPHPGRGRRRPVHLTDAGRRALAGVKPSIRAINAPEALGLSADEAAELNRLLRLVCAAPGVTAGAERPARG
jgi:DNA-binding MarR family transcriptional regulator